MNRTAGTAPDAAWQRLGTRGAARSRRDDALWLDDSACSLAHGARAVRRDASATGDVVTGWRSAPRLIRNGERTGRSGGSRPEHAASAVGLRDYRRVSGPMACVSSI
jgi:hypothetical protein